jgi:hypothetical protein
VPTSESFEIVFSKVLSPTDFSGALAELLPPGLRIDVKQEIGELPDNPGAIWAVVGSTNDPNWPCLLECLVCSNECGLGQYPDLRIADFLSRRLEVDSICSTCEFVGGLDPQDPFWSLACVGGTWYLADTFGTGLMGPYTDGAKTFPGSNKVRLIRPVEFPKERI